MNLYGSNQNYLRKNHEALVLPGRGRNGAPLLLGWRAVTVKNTLYAGAFSLAFLPVSLLLCLHVLPGWESTTKVEGKKTPLDPVLNLPGSLLSSQWWHTKLSMILRQYRGSIKGFIYRGDKDKSLTCPSTHLDNHLRDTRLRGIEERGQKGRLQVDKHLSVKPLQ